VRGGEVQLEKDDGDSKMTCLTFEVKGHQLIGDNDSGFANIEDEMMIAIPFAGAVDLIGQFMNAMQHVAHMLGEEGKELPCGDYSD